VVNSRATRASVELATLG